MHTFLVSQVVFAVVVGMCSLTQGTATKGWTAVLPKMQDDPHTFTVTDDDVAWLGTWRGAHLTRLHTLLLLCYSLESKV